MSIPIITIPIVTLIDRTRCIGRKEGNNILSCGITLALVDIFLISPGISSDFPTFRTMRRKWELKSLPRDHGCKPSEKILVNICDSELLTAVSTRSGLNDAFCHTRERIIVATGS